MEAEAWSTLINALVVIAGGVLLARFLGRRFDEIGRRPGQPAPQVDHVSSGFRDTDTRFQQTDRRFDQMDARFDQIDARFDRIDARLNAFQRSLDEMRSELTQVALAVGATGAPT